MTKAMIEFKHVTFQYDSQSEPTLKDVSFTINAGEKVLIVGPSGSGKSTIGNLINGIIPENVKGSLTGEVKIDGQDATKMSLFDTSLKVGTLLQDSNNQFVGLTVAEDIAFGMENDGVDNPTMKRNVQKWAQTLDLQHLLTQTPSSLSGGQKQRTGLAGLLVDETPVLLLDEPLAALDPLAGQASLELIDHLHQQLHNTVVIIEHRLEDVLNENVDRVLLVNDGELVGDYRPDDLLRDNVLATYGLRTPMYIEALKAAHVDLNQLQAVDAVDKVTGPTVAEHLQAAVANVPSMHATSNVAQPILQLQDVTFAYPQHPIFDHLNLTINRGDMLSIVGKNGVGKTTLSHLIAGFVMPSAGDIVLNGHSLLEQSVKQRADHIGYIMQDPDKMISQVMIYDEVALGLRLRNYPEEQIESKVLATLKVCRLYEFRNWPVSALSYGQKKRLTIASILVLEPEILILDEPTAGQDYYHYHEIMQFLQQLNQKQQMTMLFITHDMHLMAEYSNRTVVIGHRGILMDAQPYQVLANDEILRQAHLKRTSLYTLAQRFHVDYQRLSDYLIAEGGSST